MGFTTAPYRTIEIDKPDDTWFSPAPEEEPKRQPLEQPAEEPDLVPA